MRSCFRLVLVVLAVRTVPVAAQPIGVPDTTVVARLAPALFRALDDFIAKAAQDDSVRAFRLDLPDGPAWSRVRAHAMRIVDGRPPTPKDNYEWTAGMTRIAFSADTLSAAVHAGNRWRCPDGTWQGSFTEYRAFTVRHREAWQGLTVQTIGYGDSAGCSRRPDEL